MRLGGAPFRQAISRFVAGPAAIAAVLALLIAAGPAQATEHRSNLWAITRDAHGHLSVVRGDAALSTVMDSQSGHLSSEQVLSYEPESSVHALGDPLRPQQWALDAVPYESTWAVTRGNGVKVAVVDTGVLGNHQDLAGSVIAARTM
jgi:hypothetical protein